MVKVGKSEIAGSDPALAFQFQRNNNVYSPCTRKDFGEPPCPTGSVLDLRPAVWLPAVCPYHRYSKERKEPANIVMMISN